MSTRQPRLDPHSVPFTLLLASLVTLASFATDMGLPVLAATAASLNVEPGRAALTLSVFMAGFALGPLFFGPLSDGHGRRPVLLIGSAMFATFGALAAFSQSLDALLLWRFLMGTGAGACQVTVIAMVRDLFKGSEARVKQSYVNMAAGVAPVIAPTIGVGIAAIGGWRWIYGTIGIGGIVLLVMVALFITESSPKHLTHTIRTALASYMRVLSTPVTLGYALIIALNFGCLFAYITGSSLVLIGLLGVSRRAYGVLFAVSAIGLMIGALISARLSRRGVSHARLIQAGLAAIVATSLAVLLLSLTGGLRVWTLVPIVFIGFVGQGIVRPNATQGALEPMAAMAGVATAMMTGIQTLTGAGSSAIVAALFNGRSATAMTSMMALCALASVTVYLTMVRKAEARMAATHTSPYTQAPRSTRP